MNGQDEVMPRQLRVEYLAAKEQDLKERLKSNPEKLALGARWRRETTLTIRQIASRINLGSSKSANAKLHRWMREPNGKVSPAGKKNPSNDE